MRRILIFAAVCCLSFLLSVCSAPEAHNANGNGYEDNKQGGDETADNGGSEENQGGEQSDDSAETFVSFKNISSYPVSVYCGDNPHRNSSVFAEVSPGSSAKVKYNGLTDITQTFYFVYNFDFNVKNVSFPYFSSDSDDNHKSLKVQKGSVTNVIIDEITKCSTKSAFLLLDNQTTSDIYILLVDAPITPFGQQDKFIRSGGCAVYEIGDDGSFLLESAYRAKICIDAENTDLPEIDYQPGYIYTVSVTSAGAVLKAVTPFDIDTQEQIWSADVSDDTLLVSKIRPDNTGGGGFYAVGKKTYPQTSLDIIYVDKYGRVLSDKTIEITASSGQRLADADVMDYTVTKYGNICLLVQKTIEETFEYEYALMIIRMDNDGNIRLLKHIPLAEDDAGYWVFDTVVQNMLIEYEDNKFAFVGAVVDSSNNMCGFIATVDPDNDNPLTIRRSGNASDVASGVYSIFESVYYDGEDFVICGFENCDYKYEDRIHRGVVYKANRDLSHLECEYSKDKCLFFAVCGNGRDYYICGEYTDTGKSTKGCLLLSSGSGEPRFIPFPPMNYPNMLFEKIFVNKDKLYLCGTTANNIYGNDKNFATVVITDLSGRELSYTLYNEYDKAVSCVNNFIDTYLVQLHSVSPGRTRIISTDLLFKDSGVRRSILR